MKKFLLAIPLLALLLPLNFVSAASLEPSSGVYDSETNFDVKLTANPPEGEFNALSVRLKIENGEFVDFVQATGDGWIGLTQDCNSNTSFYTKDNVCLSLAKSSNLIKGELIGTLTVKVTGNTAAKITKVEGNKYSNGLNTIDDLGDVAIYYTSQSVQESLTTQDNATVVDTQQQDYSMAILFFVFVAIIVVIGGGYIVVKRRGGINSLKAMSSKGKVIAVVLGLGTLALVTGVIGLSVVNNQAPEESSASVECPAGTSYKVIANQKTCQCNNNPNLTLNIESPNNNGCFPGSCPAYTTKKISAGNAFCQCNNSSEIALNLNSSDASSCFVGSCPSGTTKKVGASGAFCQCNNASEIALNLNSANSNACKTPNTGSTGSSSGAGSGSGSGTGTGSSGSGSGSGSSSGTGTGSSGTGSNTGTGTGTGSQAPARKAICGESCNTDADCGTTGFGVKAICNANKKCASPACPSDTEFGTLCSCKTATSKCGDKCGIWDEGFQPLCGDGKSSCSWINGPTCGGKNKTYCMPKTPAAGFTSATCTNTAEASGYKYLIDATGKPITTQAQIIAACAEVASAKKCYACTTATNDGNACTSIDVGANEACPSGYTDNSSCNVAVGGSCPVDTANTPKCANIDSDNDGRLSVIDFASFAQAYNSSCTNADQTFNSCGSRDVNNDGQINIVDFASFANRYQKESCRI